VERAKEKGVSAFALLDEAAAATPPGAESLIFLPYLTGERCPIHDPAARGGFIGLTSHHGKGHLRGLSWKGSPIPCVRSVI
jgi:xylulokinase